MRWSKYFQTKFQIRPKTTEICISHDSSLTHRDYSAAANLTAMGDDLLVKLLIKNGIDPDGVVRQHLNNFIAHEVGKYKRGECRRVERLRDIVQKNPILRGEM